MPNTSTAPNLPFVFTASPPMFLVAGGPDGLLVQGTGGLLAVLGHGRGHVRPAGSTGSAAAFPIGATASALTGSRSWAARAPARSPRAPASAT